MSKKKKKYEAPIVYDMTTGVGNSVQAQNCRSGLNAGAACRTGRNAANRCKTGIQALSKCRSGAGFSPAVNCKNGPTALGKRCRSGGFASKRCRTGGIA